MIKCCNKWLNSNNSCICRTSAKETNSITPNKDHQPSTTFQKPTTQNLKPQSPTDHHQVQVDKKTVQCNDY